MKHLFYVIGGLLALPLALAADPFAASTDIVGPSTNSLITPVNQIVTPAGQQLDLPGMRPQALALSPDGRLLVTAGLSHELVVIDPASGKELQRVPLVTVKEKDKDKDASDTTSDAPILDRDKRAQISFTGLTFSPDGSRIYLLNVNGDIQVFSVATNHAISALEPIPLPKSNYAAHKGEIPTGIAVSADGKKLYVVLNISNRLLEMDAASGDILRMWDVGVAPFNVVLAGKKIYVSNFGGRPPVWFQESGPGGAGARVRVDARSIASEGSVSVIDLRQAPDFMPVHIVVGPHAGALALAPGGRWLVVACAGNDTLGVIDTHSDKVIDTICARQQPGDPFGAQPDALAFDKSGKILYCANASQNAIAVFQFHPRDTTLLGLIPVGWFPSGVVFDERANLICVSNLKGISTKKSKSRYGSMEGQNTKQYDGSVSLITVPSKGELPKLTHTALANLRYPLIAQARLPARPDRAPVPVPERVGEPSVFKHVIYIIKENRTYDQVLGDVKEGNGDASLANFGERVTPNEHKLVHEFTLLDNTYCSSALSADGHNWTDSGLGSDYLEREFGGWPRSYPAGGAGDATRDAMASSPAGFIWDDVLAHGKTVHDFGEFCTTHKKWRDYSVRNKITASDTYTNFITDADAIQYTCEPDADAMRPFIETNWCSWDLETPDVFRAARFIQRLKEFEQADDLPDFTLFWLPNDHTDGTKAKAHTPNAMVADNDLALGRVIEAVSHSKFWKDTCIFVIEDDPQNGWDHVSGYRTTAYVLSAYTRRHAVVSTQYNHTSLLRTMELMLGIPPMNQFDATATPMFDCFTNTPDFAAYDPVPSNIPLDELNPPPKKIADLQLRDDAYVSARLPLEKPDQCPEDVLNRILWRSTMGNKPYPEWAVKVVDDD